MHKNSKIDTLNQVKSLVHEFGKEIERVDQYADEKGGILKLLLSMDEIRKLQASLATKVPALTESELKSKARDFEQWFVKNGGVLRDCELAIGVAEGNGIVAKADIAENAPLIDVPARIVFALSNLPKDSKIGAFVRDDERLRNAEITPLALALLFERSNVKSFWKPYLDMLPSSFSTTLHWSAGDIALLYGSVAFDNTFQQLKTVCRQYVYLFEKLASTIGSPLSVTNFTLANFMWAISAITTRRNVVPLVNGVREDCLIPMWDMCNHFAGRVSTEFDATAKLVQCAAQQAFARDSQVTIHYGQRSIAHFLWFNGFVPREASDVNDFVELWLRPIAGDAENELRKKLLMSATNSGPPFKLRRDKIDSGALQFVRTLVLAGDALRGATAETISAPLAAEVAERQAMRLFRSALMEILSQYALDDTALSTAAAAAAAAASESAAPAPTTTASASATLPKLSVSDKRLASVNRSDPKHAALAHTLIARERIILKSCIEQLNVVLADGIDK